jgi:tetratricopeptide (TPR) repeat protein
MMVLLYDIYYKTRDYAKAETIVKKLIPFDTQYKEDLARIYSQTKKYEEALELLEALDIEKGKDLYRERLRASIYQRSGNGALRTQATEAKIAADPNNEEEYLKLIFLYSEEGNSAKAYETALKLQKINPEAEEVQLALYKFYLEDGKTEEAIKSMNIVLKSTRMDGKAKHIVLNDFLTFVNDNPAYQPQLEEAIAIFDTQVADANVYQQLADYHLKKGDKTQSLKYFEKALASDSENLELIKNTVLLQLDTQQYEKATKMTSQALDLFPSQSILYLIQGVAYNKLQKYDAAIESLEIGIDYIIEDVKMESDFYQQLGEAYTGKGNTTKASTFLEKAKSLKAQLD